MAKMKRTTQKFLDEFRNFALKGNVVELAVGIIIGSAFGKIVSSLVADIIMPVIGIILGGVHLEGLTLKIGESVVMYGKFLQTTLDFLIIAFSVFLMVKGINKLIKKQKKED